VKHTLYFLVILFFQNNLFSMQKAGAYAASSGAGLGCWAAWDNAVTAFENRQESKRLSVEQKQQVMSRLADLHKRKLLDCDPSEITLLKGEGMSADGTFAKRLYVPEGDVNEFGLQHEVGHINKKHAAQRDGAYATLMFWPYVYSRGRTLTNGKILQISILMFGARKLCSYLVARKAEPEADAFAARNCTSAADFSEQIYRYAAVENSYVRRFQEFGFSQQNAHRLFALVDPHTPFNGSRADRLAETFQARFMDDKVRQ
jgi:hypothetical protein